MFKLITKQQNFGLLQIESICRQNKFNGKIKVGYCKGQKNIVGKEENACYQHFVYFFSHSVFKRLLINNPKNDAWENIVVKQDNGFQLDQSKFLCCGKKCRYQTIQGLYEPLKERF